MITGKTNFIFPLQINSANRVVMRSEPISQSAHITHLGWKVSTAGNIPYHGFKKGGYFLKQVLIGSMENFL